MKFVEEAKTIVKLVGGEKNINNLLNSSINFDLEVLSNINDIVKQLEKLLQDEDLLNLCVNVYSKDKEWYN